MSAFTVALDNQPGELARLCEAMASSGVNLLLCATTHADRGVVALIAEDEASAQTVLGNEGIGISGLWAAVVRGSCVIYLMLESGAEARRAARLLSARLA